MDVKIISSELLRKNKPVRQFREGTVLKEHLSKTHIDKDGKRHVAHEFIGTDDFAAAFYQRQQYEVDAGRDLEPILYAQLYRIIEDRTLPRNVPVNRLGPAGVVFQKIEEGGEVKFASVGQSNFSVPIYHYAFGLEYTDDLVEYNELWSLSEVERQAGTAYNALLNHIHFSPILNYAFAAGNQTTGVGGAFGSTTQLPEAYLRTIEKAITHGVDDTTNPRRGPYVILCSTSNLFTLERAVNVVPQQGITRQSSAIQQINGIIAYNGWTGTQGLTSTTYPGVTAGKCYLVDVGRADRNLRSYVKHPLRRQAGDGDVSRFILEQTVWDVRFGTYADVAASTEEITLPTAADLV